MYELPIFPLNTVLFPGTPIHLHIFEERYKQMIGLCIQEQKPFGVVLIRHGLEALGPVAEPHQVGCSAQIIHVQRLSQGRMNIVAVGQERFRIHTLDRQSYPYLVATVDSLDLEDPEPTVARNKTADLRQQVEHYAQKVMDMGGVQIDVKHIPEEPVALAYLAAALLQISPVHKQKLLEISRLDWLLDELIIHYRREITLVQAMATPRQAREVRGFSMN